jgi:hypothetical protein
VPHTYSTLRALTTGALVAALTIGGLAATTAPASALAAPGDLKSDIRNSSTAVLSWGAIKKATSYEVQVDAASSFSSPDFTLTTSNTKAVPTKSLIPGKNYWRVRSAAGSTRSDWVSGSFDIAPVTVPIPLAPSNGQSLDQPGNPPLLQWSSSQGATSYTIQVDADADMIGAKAYTTKTTSLVVPDPLTTGDWFWRVTAVKGTGLISLPSAVSSFVINPVSLPTITYPVDDVTRAIEDVVLDWSPVPGARTYDLQVATDDDFNNVTLTVTNVYGTRYSPPVTLRNDQFYWRVRAVDLAGQQTPWTESKFGFQRQWLDKTTLLYPAGTEDAPGATNTSMPFYEWTPIQHAAIYELYTSGDPFFSTGVDKCSTAGTTYVPRSSSDCGFRTSGVTYWQVRAIDTPYSPSPGLPGVFSDVHAFTWTPPVVAPAPFDQNDVPDGLKVSVSGMALSDGAKACSDNPCEGVPATPVFSWNPVDGATFYRVWVALDENFTFKAMGSTSFLQTTNTAAALMFGSPDDVSTLKETTAGSAYYWYVQACSASLCGLSPVSQDPPLPGVKSFKKQSPAVGSLSASNVNGTDITFDWQDYIEPNTVPNLWRGQTGTQSAKNYQIQIDNEPSFATPIDTAIVDQTTYTAADQLYPEGTYFWRVQARDAENNGLTWSAVQSFTKSSPPVELSSPVGGVQVPGTTPFRWAAQPFAGSYSVELYRNNDQTFSTANRVFAATVKTVAYTPASPIPASGTPYLWRVRRNDTSGNPGPWSTPQSFYSAGVAPSLLSPKAGIWLKNAGALFEWTEVPGAASYKLDITGTKAGSVTTVATAYAPGAHGTGSYAWAVTAYDGAGNPLATSATRQYKVDATAPFIKKFAPGLDELKAKSTIKATFSERVRGISGKSIKMYKLKGKKWVRITVKIKSLKRGKVASIDPKGRLRAGDYQIRFSTRLIKDLRGNNLVPSNVASMTSAKLRADLRIRR